MPNKLVHVTATITLKTSFKSYNNDSSDDKAIKQIKIWCEETLAQEGDIPLFVNGPTEEDYTKEPRITVTISRDE